ncbi:MAG: hypothetical protein QXP36_02105 [Conexivisphaerales archaeon]
MKNYDIDKAGPTLLKHITDVDLTQMEDKVQRNIEYGNLLKNDDRLKVIPYILKSFIQRIAKEYQDIIITTPDSFVTRLDIRDIELVNRSVFTFKVEWSATELVVSKTKRSYIAMLNNDDVLVKGIASRDISNKLARKLFSLFDTTLEQFKKSFLRLPVEYFLVNDMVVVDNQLVKVNDIQRFDRKVNYEYYWRKSLQFIYPIEMYKKNINIL